MRKLALALVVAATLGSTAANALGLGDVQLQSRLNQPLNANIQLVALRGTAPEEIEVRMAPADEFDKAGIERMYALNEIRFSVEGEGDNVSIRLKTKDAVREPFLNFIVEVTWPSGRLLREYTVLLDPPTFAEEAPVVSTPIYTAPESTPSSSGDISSAPTMSQAPAAEPVVRDESRPMAVANTMAGANSYGPTRASETLWSIASRVRPENATVHQTLVAIFKANPQAFANNNPNQMLQDQTLNIPSEEEILRTPHRRALSEFVSQTGAVLETRSTRQAETPTASSGQLVVSAPEQATSTRGGKTSTSSREAAEVLNQENANLRNQLERKQREAERLEKLVKLKDEQLSTISEPEQSTSSTETAPVTDNSTTDTTPESSTDSPVETAATESPSEATEPQPEPEQKPKPSVRVPQQVEEPSLVDTLMDNLLYILGGIGVVGLMVGGMILHRRRVGNEKFQDTLLSPEPMAETPLQFNDDLDLPEVGEDILAPQMPSDDSIAGSDVVADPLGEADIYIAYGKFEQAEQLLTRALQDAPNRHELRLKLLECYAEMHDAEKFRSQVNMFQDVIDSDPSIAAQVDQLQQRAWPKDDIVGGSLPTADDIFGSVGVGTAAVAANKTMETKTGEWAPTSAWEAPKSEQSSWTPPVAETPMTAAASDDFSLDAHDDFGGFKNTKEDAPLDTPSDDFNFDLDSAEPAQPAWEQAAPDRLGSGSGSDDLMLDMDDDSSLPSGDELGMGEIDEIATKLDLARAYIEMHETDGAREILQEVVAEGNATQKKEAETLLSRL